MCECKSFHIRAPATGKARRPTVESLMAETKQTTNLERHRPTSKYPHLAISQLIQT